MNLIIAHRYKHAEYFARHIQHWKLSEYRIVMTSENLRGLNSGESKIIYVVNAPRHYPTLQEMETRIEIRNVLMVFRNATIVEVDLP